jgi:hypothetical protein
MLDQLLEEINELKNYKKMYENQKADKIRMSEKLYELMLEKYNNTPYEERVKLFENESCSCCKGHYYCQIEKLPEDIMKPIPSCNGWIPGTTCCSSFEWS